MTMRMGQLRPALPGPVHDDRKLFEVLILEGPRPV